MTRETMNVRVIRVKSVKKSDTPLVVENVDTVSIDRHVSSRTSLRNNAERPPTTVSVTRISRAQSLKSTMLDKTSDNTLRSEYNSKSHVVQSNRSDMQSPTEFKANSQSKKKTPLTTSTTVQLFDSNSISFSKSKNRLLKFTFPIFSAGDQGEIHTIGKQKINKNKKSSLCQKCPLQYCVAFAVILFIIVGMVIALPVIIVVTLSMTSPQTISTTSTIVTQSTATSTTTSTTSSTSVTTATAAATVTITSNACTSGWMGITMKYHCDSCSQQYTYAPLSFNYIAIANVTRITFALRRDFGYFGIDDVSICDAAAPTIELLSNGGFETGNFSSWTHCVQTGSLSTGSVESTSSGISYNGYTFTARTSNYFYLGGATVNTEYLSQTFPSIIGHTYIFSFAYVYVGNGSLNSGDFLLST